MHHFLFEFITGGGLAGQDLPRTLIKEGTIMLQTLLTELISAGHVDISLTRDQRVNPHNQARNEYMIQQPIAEELASLMQAVDVSWLIAPETNDCLATLAELFIQHSKVFIGSNPEAIRIASSKLLSNKMLAEANINVVETATLSGNIPASQTGWIVKPDDGVGAEDCYLIKNKKQLTAMINSKQDGNLIIQPYIDGQSMSMSLLVFGDDVQLLACNKQYILIENEALSLVAVGVNECLSYKDKMQVLAKKIVDNIAGLVGYIGVDMIEMDNELFVLDINPRFTTAYAGLSESLGCNVTDLILNTFLNNNLPDIDLTKAGPVRINI